MIISRSNLGLGIKISSETKAREAADIHTSGYLIPNSVIFEYRLNVYLQVQATSLTA